MTQPNIGLNREARIPPETIGELCAQIDAQFVAGANRVFDDLIQLAYQQGTNALELVRWLSKARRPIMGRVEAEIAADNREFWAQ